MALCAALAASTLSCARAEAPRSVSVAGIALGDTSASVTAHLRRVYPQCKLKRSIYRALPGEDARPVADVALNERTLDVCPGTPEGSDSVDVVVARFAHPSIDPQGGVFEIRFDRSYPDPALSSAREVRYPLEKVLAKLRQQYGRPTDERRDRVASTSANLAKSLGVGSTVKREDFLVRLLWADSGKLDADWSAERCACTGRYVHAQIEMSRSLATRPANRYYVTRVAVSVRDTETWNRQQAWNAQWSGREK
jgi:hypothetical protein